jgi:hypothetical protein
VQLLVEVSVDPDGFDVLNIARPGTKRDAIDGMPYGGVVTRKGGNREAEQQRPRNPGGHGNLDQRRA